LQACPAWQSAFVEQVLPERWARFAAKVQYDE
jgi:hypothetical protein